MKKLLVLKEKDDRKKIAKVLAEAGIKVNYDSGGRALSIDVPQNSEDKLRQLPFGAQIVDPKDASDFLSDPDENEKIFMGAIQLRNTTEFVRKLNKFKPGESPEEIELLSAPHFIHEEIDGLQ